MGVRFLRQRQEFFPEPEPGGDEAVEEEVIEGDKLFHPIVIVTKHDLESWLSSLRERLIPFLDEGKGIRLTGGRKEG